MKIAFVLNHFLPTTIGGTEIYVWNLAKGLMEKNSEVIVVVPHYDDGSRVDYLHEGIRVICFPEQTYVDRSLLFGKRKPESIRSFMEIIRSENPDVIHFHELSGSRGSTLFHLKEVFSAGFKTLMTFHIAGYTCKTGTMNFREKVPCDGKFILGKCSICHLSATQSDIKARVVHWLSAILFRIGIDLRPLNNTLATGLSTHFILNEYASLLSDISKNTSRTISISKWYTNVLALNLKDLSRNVLIETGLEALHFQGSQAVRAQSKCIKVVYIGRITPSKGLDLLIEASSDFQVEELMIDIFGVVSSADTKYYEGLIERTSGKMNIRWQGKLEHQQVHHTLMEYDLLCLPSRTTEMSSLILKEAMAAKLPVVVSDTVGNKELVKHGINGLMFKSGSASALKEQLTRCVLDPQLLFDMGANCSPVKKLEETTEAHLRLYAEILSE